MFKTSLVILTILILSGCGKKDETTLQPDTIEVICKTLRSENASKCVTNPGVATPANEICLLGFGAVEIPGQIIPSAVKQNVDNGLIKMVNKNTGKALKLTTVSGNPNYLIVQHVDDVGFTSSVSLPICPN